MATYMHDSIWDRDSYKCAPYSTLPRRIISALAQFRTESDDLAGRTGRWMLHLLRRRTSDMLSLSFT